MLQNNLTVKALNVQHSLSFGDGSSVMLTGNGVEKNVSANALSCNSTEEGLVGPSVTVDTDGTNVVVFVTGDETHPLNWKATSFTLIGSA